MAGAVDHGQAGAGDPGGHGSRHGRGPGRRAPTITRVGRGDLGEPVVERLHRPLPGGAEAGREPGRIVGRGGSRGAAAAPAAPSARASPASTGVRSQASTNDSIPSRSRPRASASSAVAASRALRRIGDAGGRRLEDEATRHACRVGDRQPERDARAHRVADDVRSIMAERIEELRKVVGDPLHRRPAWARGIGRAGGQSGAIGVARHAKPPVRRTPGVSAVTGQVGRDRGEPGAIASSARPGAPADAARSRRPLSPARPPSSGRSP